MVVNGDFEKVDVLGKPEGWFFHGPVSVEKEERNTFVRIKGGTVAGGYYRQEMERPNNVTHGTIRVKLRTHGCIGFDRSRVNANISCKNEEGKVIFWIMAISGRKDGVWTTIHGEGAIPKEATWFCFELNYKGSKGQVDFDDVEVTFK